MGALSFACQYSLAPLRYAARQAVPLNLAVSLITVAASLIIRGGALSLSPLVPFIPVILALTTEAVAAAFVGTALVGRISNVRLEQVILVLLVTIGSALIVEAFLPQNVPALVPATPSDV